MGHARGLGVNGMGSHERPNKGSTDRWLTPLPIVQSLGEFDLDPCGEEFHPTAKTIYTENGLGREWFGRVWLNPPYSEVWIWLDKLVEHGRGVALVFARTDTRWAQKALREATSVFFLAKRIKFTNPEKESKWTAGAPSMFLSFGETPDWGRIGHGIQFVNGKAV